MAEKSLAQIEAIYTYTVARLGGSSREDAAHLAWLSARNVLRHLRAPCWHEQIFRNSSSVKSYCSPLGIVLGVYVGEYGSHSAKWPRTKASEKMADLVRDKILDYLESHYKQAIKDGGFNYINEAYGNI